MPEQFLVNLPMPNSQPTKTSHWYRGVISAKQNYLIAIQLRIALGLFIAKPKGKANNRDALSLRVCIYVCIYVCIGQHIHPMQRQ